jgi:hypothetical protein
MAYPNRKRSFSEAQEDPEDALLSQTSFLYQTKRIHHPFLLGAQPSDFRQASAPYYNPYSQPQLTNPTIALPSISSLSNPSSQSVLPPTTASLAPTLSSNYQSPGYPPQTFAWHLLVVVQSQPQY